MPIFVYTGPHGSLSIAGRSLDRGQPTRLEGRAAEAAAGHLDIEPYAEPAERAPEGPSYADLQATAKALGIPASGSKVDLAAAIAAEEARLAAEAAAADASGTDSNTGAGAD